MTAPIGAEVGIGPLRWMVDEALPDDGDCLLSVGGSAYLIVEARQMERPTRQGWPRIMLRAIKLDGEGAIPDGARVIRFWWDSRSKRRPEQ